eukprot:scaffold602_cov342-Prasinococcus_capsulatus_cf.AAC.23
MMMMTIRWDSAIYDRAHDPRGCERLPAAWREELESPPSPNSRRSDAMPVSAAGVSGGRRARGGLGGRRAAPCGRQGTGSRHGRPAKPPPVAAAAAWCALTMEAPVPPRDGRLRCHWPGYKGRREAAARPHGGKRVSAGRGGRQGARSPRSACTRPCPHSA